MITAELLNIGSRKCYDKPPRKHKVKTVKAKQTTIIINKEIGKQCAKYVLYTNQK
jgi:hypothetical protein